MGGSSASVRRRLVMGNWKMNGSLAANAALLEGLRDALPLGSAAAPADGRAAAADNGRRAQVVVCAPYPYLVQAGQSLQGSAVQIGAQDLSLHASGAYTGEVSGAMLADVGCRWVLVGHSERRTHHGETDHQVALKAQAALAAGLTPVVCIGETLAEHKAGHTLGAVARQLAPVLALGEQAVQAVVIAYEPVWAIGTGQTATPEQAQTVHEAIRASLASVGARQQPILYGGSVNAGNAADLFAMPDIDGALVGGASLVLDDFLRIVAA